MPEFQLYWRTLRDVNRSPDRTPTAEQLTNMLKLATQTDNVSVSNAAVKRLQDWGIYVVKH